MMGFLVYASDNCGCVAAVTCVCTHVCAPQHPCAVPWPAALVPSSHNRVRVGAGVRRYILNLQHTTVRLDHIDYFLCWDFYQIYQCV